MIREIDMYLASLLRHTVKAAALYGVGKILCLFGSLILRIDLEMDAYPVPAALHDCRRDAHAENPRVFLFFPADSRPSCQHVTVYQLPFFRVQAHRGHNRFNPVERQRFPHPQKETYHHIPAGSLLGKHTLLFQHARIMEHILLHRVVLPVKNCAIRDLRDAKIHLSAGVRGIRKKVCSKVACQTAQKHPVAFLILQQKFRDARPARRMIRHTGLPVTGQNSLYHFHVCQCAVLEAAALFHAVPVHRVRPGFQV